MKKMIIDGVVDLGQGKTSTVGAELKGLLEAIPGKNMADSVRQIDLADALEPCIEKGQKYFHFEETAQQHIEHVLEVGSQNFAPKVIVPIKRALDAAEAYKPVEPAKKSKEG